MLSKQTIFAHRQNIDKSISILKLKSINNSAMASMASVQLARRVILRKMAKNSVKGDRYPASCRRNKNDAIMRKSTKNSAPFLLFTGLMPLFFRLKMNRFELEVTKLKRHVEQFTF